ncbi:MAG: hypothetical protein ACM3ZV_01790 [Bacillota bacterium]
MTSTATRLLITFAFAAAGASAAGAQSMGPGSAAPLPGTGDSTKISQGNRDNNQAYNQLIGAADQTTKKDDRAQSRHAAVPATAADIKAGASLRDIKGVKIGTIASVDATQAVVDTGQTKIGVPLIAFGKDDQGLLLGMTADKFNKLVAQAHAKPGSN